MSMPRLRWKFCGRMGGRAVSEGPPDPIAGWLSDGSSYLSIWMIWMTLGARSTATDVSPRDPKLPGLVICYIAIEHGHRNSEFSH